ncbi:hypothetical protein PAP18089_05138 [Pandoraea apista]|uniref:Uncharacterized protein n=1 Tax=Pandoraea apista TaxID=93218 RepID=A0A5E5PBR0_9BURK|nr:hypothetical protein LMG16407_00049 [Pandoraea apista]VVG74126.1 hypothetical protein PAP18089_05138 [Pandoraea apista]
MSHLYDFIDSLLTNDTCVETGMQCAMTIGHFFGY